MQRSGVQFPAVPQIFLHENKILKWSVYLGAVTEGEPRLGGSM